MGAPEWVPQPKGSEPIVLGCRTNHSAIFRRRNPGYLKCDANWRSIVETMAHNLLGEDDLETEEAQELLINGGYWTLANLEAAYKAVARQNSKCTSKVALNRVSRSEMG